MASLLPEPAKGSRATIPKPGSLTLQAYDTAAIGQDTRENRGGDDARRPARRPTGHPEDLRGRADPVPRPPRARVRAPQRHGHPGAGIPRRRRGSLGRLHRRADGPDRLRAGQPHPGRPRAHQQRRRAHQRHAAGHARGPPAGDGAGRRGRPGGRRAQRDQGQPERRADDRPAVRHRGAGTTPVRPEELPPRQAALRDPKNPESPGRPSITTMVQKHSYGPQNFSRTNVIDRPKSMPTIAPGGADAPPGPTPPSRAAGYADSIQRGRSGPSRSL